MQLLLQQSPLTVQETRRPLQVGGETHWPSRHLFGEPHGAPLSATVEVQAPCALQLQVTQAVLAGQSVGPRHSTHSRLALHSGRSCGQPGSSSVQQASSSMQVVPQHVFPAGQPGRKFVQQAPAAQSVQAPRRQIPSQHPVTEPPQIPPSGWQQVWFWQIDPCAVSKPQHSSAAAQANPLGQQVPATQAVPQRTPG
jgi:hypothetical protein